LVGTLEEDIVLKVSTTTIPESRTLIEVNSDLVGYTHPIKSIVVEFEITRPDIQGPHVGKNIVSPCPVTHIGAT
jgi:hypothetical protein